MRPAAFLLGSKGSPPGPLSWIRAWWWPLVAFSSVPAGPEGTARVPLALRALRALRALMASSTTHIPAQNSTRSQTIDRCGSSRLSGTRCSRFNTAEAQNTSSFVWGSSIAVSCVVETANSVRSSKSSLVSGQNPGSVPESSFTPRLFPSM